MTDELPKASKGVRLLPILVKSDISHSVVFKFPECLCGQLSRKFVPATTFAIGYKTLNLLNYCAIVVGSVKLKTTAI